MLNGFLLSQTKHYRLHHLLLSNQNPIHHLLLIRLRHTLHEILANLVNFKSDLERIIMGFGWIWSALSQQANQLHSWSKGSCFFTESGAGSLGLRSMKVREFECEGLNHFLVQNYVFSLLFYFSLLLLLICNLWNMEMIYGIRG